MFCSSLKDKNPDSIKNFLNLSKPLQTYFLESAWKILSIQIEPLPTEQQLIFTLDFFKMIMTSNTDSFIEFEKRHPDFMPTFEYVQNEHLSSSQSASSSSTDESTKSKPKKAKKKESKEESTPGTSQGSKSLLTHMLGVEPEKKSQKIEKRKSKAPSKTEETEEEKPTTKRGRKPKTEYAKEYQKAETPEEGSALYVFYTSLYAENPNSKLAVTWLIEHDVYEADSALRKGLVKKYVELEKKGELFKMR